MKDRQWFIDPGCRWELDTGMPRQAYDWAKYDAHKKEEGPSGPQKKKTGLALLKERDGVKPVQSGPEGDPATWRLVVRKLGNISAGVTAVVGYALAVSSGTNYYVKEQDRQVQVAMELDAQAESLIRLANAFPQHQYLHPSDPQSFVEVSYPSGNKPTRLLIDLEDPTSETLWFVKQQLESMGVTWECAIDGDSDAPLEQKEQFTRIGLQSPDFLKDHMRPIPPSAPSGKNRLLPDIIAHFDAVSSADPHQDKRVSVLIRRSNGNGMTKGVVNQALYGSQDSYARVSIGPDTFKKAPSSKGEDMLAGNVVVEPKHQYWSPLQQAAHASVQQGMDEFLYRPERSSYIAADLNRVMDYERRKLEHIAPAAVASPTAIAADTLNVLDDEEEMMDPMPE